METGITRASAPTSRFVTARRSASARVRGVPAHIRPDTEVPLGMERSGSSLPGFRRMRRRTPRTGCIAVRLGSPAVHTREGTQALGLSPRRRNWRDRRPWHRSDMAERTSPLSLRTGVRPRMPPPDLSGVRGTVLPPAACPRERRTVPGGLLPRVQRVGKPAPVGIGHLSGTDCRCKYCVKIRVSQTQPNGASQGRWGPHCRR
jgi:hypothetical protein